MHSGPLGCLTKLGAKWADLVQNFVPQTRVGIFRNECTRSTQFDPKLTFWCILYYLGAFETIWLPYETPCKTGRTSSKVRATKSGRIFSQRRHRSTPCDPKLIFSCVRAIWVHSGLFGCHTKLGAKWAELVQKFVPRSRVRIFHNESTRSTPIGPKTDVLMRFVLFGCIRDHLVALRNSEQNGPN